MSDLREIATYRDLKDYLDTLSDGELSQSVQVAPHEPDGDRPTVLLPGIAIGTVGALEIEQTRSSYDNAHHPGAIVILTDWNPFAEDGTVGFNLMTGGRIDPRTEDEPC